MNQLLRILSILFLKLFIFPSLLFAQKTFPANGVRDERHIRYAFIHANIVAGSEATLNDATLIILNGLIENIGKNIPVPEGTLVYDLKGKYIYPSFIDIFSDYGL